VLAVRMQITLGCLVDPVVAQTVRELLTLEPVQQVKETMAEQDFQLPGLAEAAEVLVELVETQLLT
jgi:hypothetical protein